MRVALLPLTVSTTRTASRLLPLWHLARLRTQGPAGPAGALAQAGALRLVQTASAFEALRARERAPSVNQYLGCQLVQARARALHSSSQTPYSLDAASRCMDGQTQCATHAHTDPGLRTGLCPALSQRHGMAR